MIMTEFTHRYLLLTLSNNPDVFDALLAGVTADDPRWDFRPDPERFTLREVIAHLADWNPIFEERIRRIRAEDTPQLPSYDEGRFAIDRDYAHSDAIANLSRFRKGRLSLVDAFRDVRDEEWGRPGIYNEVHHMTVETYLAAIVAHDGYHTGQVAKWLKEAS